MLLKIVRSSPGERTGLTELLFSKRPVSSVKISIGSIRVLQAQYGYDDDRSKRFIRYAPRQRVAYCRCCGGQFEQKYFPRSAPEWFLGYLRNIGRKRRRRSPKNRSLYAECRYVRRNTPNVIGGVATAMIFDEKIVFPADAITKPGFCT